MEQLSSSKNLSTSDFGRPSRPVHNPTACLFDLRVGIRAGREVAVRLLLLFDHRDVGVAHFFQSAGHRLQAGTIQRAIHDGYIFINFFAKENRLALDLLHECGVDLVRNVLDAAVCHTCFKVAGLDVCKNV